MSNDLTTHPMYRTDSRLDTLIEEIEALKARVSQLESRLRTYGPVQYVSRDTPIDPTRIQIRRSNE